MTLRVQLVLSGLSRAVVFIKARVRVVAMPMVALGPRAAIVPQAMDANLVLQVLVRT